MASPAAVKYRSSAERARVLRDAISDSRFSPLARDAAQVFAHAYLTSIVAAWDAYINELVRNFYAETADPLNPLFHAIHSVAQRASEERRFNTPNWENTRNFLILTTGYDPISDWIWPVRKMGVQQIQERLNQVLRVRHSFAHGFGIPAYPWTRSRSGRVRLTMQSLRDTEKFFRNLVERTDAGMKKHLRATFGKGTSW